LSDLEAEPEQLAMDVRCSPKSILNAHPPDQRLQIYSDLRPASQRAGFPAPVAAKPGTMPAHDSLGPDDRNGVEDRRKPAIQQDEEQSITVGELDPTAHLALQYG
jgi:hypothetical protein